MRPLLTALLLAAPALAQQDRKHETPSRAEVKKLFENNCASCHLPPDTTFAVDRAWITQIADTA